MNKAQWGKRWRAARGDVWALSVIVIFFAAFFYPVVFNGKFFVVNDAFVELYPLRAAMWDEIRQGRLPLWTPLIMSGYPILSMAQNAVGYPLTWGYLFLPNHWAEQIYTLTPYLLCPAFIYAYAREMKRSRLAALLAGLAFSYGGLMVSAVANNGLLPNAVMWLPLMLIAIDRARTRPFIPCLLGATAAYALSVLTGVGQGFLYAGLVAGSYALFLVCASNSLSDDKGVAHGWKEWPRWRPLFVAGGAVVLAAGVAAFQILETMRAARRSIRSILSYELFTEGSYTIWLAVKALLFPLHYVNHATPCVPLLAILLAVIGVVVAAQRNTQRDVRIFFWLAVAFVAWVLMLGPNTPLYRALYHVPIFNSFRAPARHAFEWTFAVAILSAYGWDAAKVFCSRAQRALGQSDAKRILVGLVLLLAALALVILWREDFAKLPPRWDESNHYPAYPELRYLAWKLVFTLCAAAVVWTGWKIASARWRAALLAVAVGAACFVEPSIMASRWWWPALKTRERFTAAAPTTRLLQNYPPEQNRIYTRAVLWTEEYQQQPRLDSGNLTMLYGLRNAGGYEPLILERYSRALGGVWMDTSNPRPGFKPNTDLFEPHSHVLDILNTTFVVSYADLLTEPTLTIEREGIRFSAPDISQEVRPGETIRVAAAARECDTLALVTSLADSISEADGATVAKLRVFTADGRAIEREVRAGADTAEWAHERPDVKERIRHPLARILDSFPGDEKNSFTFHRYWTRISLGERVRVERIEISNVSPHAIFGLWKMTLYDSATNFSMPLPHYDLERWEPVYEKDGVQIIRNRRALPRAWLVTEAEAVDGEEALRRIRGESERSFDPRRTALLEVSAQELPRLPGGPPAPDASARITVSEPNRLVIETNATQPTVLVVSEVNYPGWVATVDGNRAQIHTADYLLRGVVLPAGKHQVEMRYTAPGALTGALISLSTLLLICALVGYHYGKDNRRLRAGANWLRDLNRRLRVTERASRIRKLRGASFLLCGAFAVLMIYNCVFPLNAVWATNGIVEPDCGQMIWNLWHVNEAVTSGRNPYATSLLYHPLGVPNLSHHSLAAGFFPVTFLVKLLSGASLLYPLYAYRLLILLCFTLLFYFSYRLLRELNCTRWAAAIAAVAYSFADFYMEHVAHLNMLAGFFIPLAALSLLRLYRQPQRFANLLSVALLLSCAIYFTEFTLFIYMGLVLIVCMMLLWSAERRALCAKLKQVGRRRLLTGLALYAIIVAPFLYLLLTDDFIKPPPAESSFYSANLAGFFAPHPQRTPLYGNLFAGLSQRITTGIGGYEVFTSFVLLSGAALALWKARQKYVSIAAVAALTFYVLSLGPTLKILNLETGVMLPYKLLMQWPPFDASRTPSRFVVMGIFFLMIVAARGLTWLNERLIARRGERWSFAMMLLIFAWAAAESYSPTPRQQPVAVPQDLAARVQGPVLNLPVHEADGHAMFLQTQHRQPIATGYLARSSQARQQHLNQWRQLSDKGGARLCEAAARAGFKSIIVAPAQYRQRIAPDTGPPHLGQCSLDIIDLRQNATPAEQPESFPLYATGMTINFNTAEATPFLWYGWSSMEPFSRWSDKGRAAVVFSLPEIRDHVLHLRMSPFLVAGKLDAQRVRIEINEQPLTTLTLTDQQPQTYTITIPAAALRHNNILTFELPDAESPSALGTSGDVRLLGINVQWIKLD